MTTVLTEVESEVFTEAEFPVVIFVLHLHRQRRFYLVNLIIPCLLLSVVALATFKLPPSSGDRLGIGVYLSFIVLT